jgi:hypothetical protein
VRVGILTFHHVFNYGALLQTYALQSKLQQMGNDPFVINIIPFRRSRHPLLGGYGISRGNLLQRVRYKSAEIRKYKRFNDFRKTYLHMTRPFNRICDFLISCEKVDAIVVGSDQVWNEKYGASALKLYLLQHLPEHRPITLSYAASCGKPMQESVIFAQSRFEGFDHLSVRDTFTQKLIRDCCGRHSTVVVDPSLLIDWNKALTINPLDQTPEQYIFLYGFSQESLTVSNELKKILGCAVVGVPMENDFDESGVDWVIRDAGIAEWLWLLKNASYVCTKSYHGMMLSIMYKKPFIVTVGSSPGRARLFDAAERFGVLNYVWSGKSNGDIQTILNQRTDNEAFERVMSLAKTSSEFLYRAINGLAT